MVSLNRIKVVLVEQQKTGKWLAGRGGVRHCGHLPGRRYGRGKEVYSAVYPGGSSGDQAAQCRLQDGSAGAGSAEEESGPQLCTGGPVRP